MNALFIQIMIQCVCTLNIKNQNGPQGSSDKYSTTLKKNTFHYQCNLLIAYSYLLLFIENHFIY